MVTALVALHDVGPEGRRANSPPASVYIVKPKMHGPDEVAFAVELFGRVEAGARPGAGHAEDRHHGRGAADHGQPRGVHPRGEGRGSSSSTPASSTAPATRSTPRWRRAPVDPQGGDASDAAWYTAYEDRNVDVGPRLRPARPRADRQGHVGDARPDGGDAREKGAQPKQGANTAWVPSPTAATLHATHYHLVDVAAAQAGLDGRASRRRSTTS